MQQYSDFIEINQDFTPVYTEHGGQSLWKSFIPHHAFTQMLEKLLNGLVNGDPTPWLQGPYGTGKTFAAYTLKHIFEENLDEVKAYFDKHELLKPFWGKLLAARQRGPVLVIYHDSSAEDHADSLHLFHSLQQKIHAVLCAKKLNEVAEESLLAQARDRVKASNWPNVFIKHRHLFEEFGTDQDVLDKLRDYPSPQLLVAITRALLNEGIVVRQSADDFSLWCQKLVTENSLDGLIVLCDELTDFIRPGAPLTTLQSLAAHNTGSRFLFVPITHKPLTEAIADKATARKIKERFEEVQFHMPTPTAFRLLKHCITVRQGREESWFALHGKLESETHNLISWFDSTFSESSSQKKVDGALELPALLPLHPFTSALLSNISEHYLSSQRTLFSFMASTNPDKPSPFQHFLCHSIDEYPLLLTADSLFHFFFMENGHDKADFAPQASLLINQYRQRETSLDTSLSKKLYATITLLQILRTSLHAIGWQTPCESVLWNCYQGAVPRDDFNAALALLLDKQILGVIERDGDREFVSPDATIDHSKLKKYQEKMKAMSFEAVASEIKLDAEILPRFIFAKDTLPHQQSAFFFATYDSLLKRRSGVIKGELPPHQMAFVLCACQKDSEVTDLYTLCRDLAEKNPLHVYIALHAPFTESKFQQVQGYLAEAAYYQDVNDASRKIVAQQQYRKIVTAWVDYAVRETRIFARCLSSDYPDGFVGEKKNGMEACLKKTFSRGLWPYVGMLATLCRKGQAGNSTAKLIFGKGNPTTQNKELLRTLQQLDAKPDTDTLKSLVATIREAFTDSDEVNLADLWLTLRRPPFGLYDSQATCLILAHAIKEYVGSWYHYDEQEHDDMLNQDSLCSLVVRIMKDECKQRETLRIMSASDKDFCAFVRIVCTLDEKEALFPDNAQRSMNVWLNRVKYPLCGLCFLDSWHDETPKEGRLAEALDLLAQILANESPNTYTLRKNFMELLGNYPGLKDSLEKVLCPEALQNGLQQALGPDTPRMTAALREQDISVAWLRDRLHAHHSRDMQYWTKESIVQFLPTLEADYHLLTTLNNLLGQSHTTLDDATVALVTRMKAESLPLCVFDQTDVKKSLPFMPYLLTFIGSPGELDTVKRDSLASALARDKDKDTTREVLWRNLASTLRNWASPYLGEPLSGEDVHFFLEEHAPLDLFIDSEKLVSLIRRFQAGLTSRRSATRFKKAFAAAVGAESPAAWSTTHGFPLHMVWPCPEGQKVFSLFESGLNPTPQAFDEGTELLKNTALFAALAQPTSVAQRFISRVAPEFAVFVATDAVAAELSQFMKVQLGDDAATWNEEGMLPYIQDWAQQQYVRRIKPQLDSWLQAQSQEVLQQLMSDLLEDPLMGIKIRRKVRE